MLLGQVLTPKDLRLCQAHFSWDVSQVEVSRVAIDGAGGTRGSTKGSLLTVSGSLTLDNADVPQRADGTLDLDTDPEDRRTLYHELFHLTQQRRGFWERLKMLYWRNRYRTHGDRPHEQEAHETAHAWMLEDTDKA